jgi:hypothetical protein
VEKNLHWKIGIKLVVWLTKEGIAGHVEIASFSPGEPQPPFEKREARGKTNADLDKISCPARIGLIFHVSK